MLYFNEKNKFLYGKEVKINRFSAEEKGFTLKELIAIFAVVIIFIIILAPLIGRIREKANLLVCRENMEEISIALRLYASEHNGRFPTALGELLKEGYLADEKIFDCPNDPHIGNAENPDYEYTSGCDIHSPSRMILISDATPHKNKRHVLYINGRIDSIQDDVGQYSYVAGAMAE